MCGRYSLRTDHELIKEHFDIKSSQVFKPRYNIAPSNMIPVIKESGVIDFATWGLVPKWMKNRLDLNPLINVREETIIEKPTFNQDILKSRCIIPADGYFEWKEVGRIKQPFYITKGNHNIFAFAGIMVGETVAIITKDSKSSPIISKLHARMPVILDKNQYFDWLNHKLKKDQIINILEKVSGLDYSFYPVSTVVNYVKNDNFACIEALHD